MSADLEYQYILFKDQMGDTFKSGSKGNIVSWRPLLPDGWFYLGQSLNYDPTAAVPISVIVRANKPDILVEVTSWEKVWDDAGSGCERFYSLWRGVAPSDYVVLGGILSNNKDYAPPTAEQTRGIMAIHKDYTTPGHAKEKWNDHGTWARKEGSVWSCDGVNNGDLDGNVHVLIPVNNYHGPEAGGALGLNPDRCCRSEEPNEDVCFSLLKPSP
ncbi:FDS protein [Mycena latifolia]|nr:FDS protein [Mycena latifolia]